MHPFFQSGSCPYQKIHPNGIQYIQAVALATIGIPRLVEA
jgi:hypothetical protein